MSTMSNSRVDRRALALVLLLCSACATAPVAPDAPRMRKVSAPERTPPAVSPRDERVEIESAVVRRASEHPELLQGLTLDPSRAADLLLIDVRTEQPLGDIQRSASPVIVLDGEPLLDTKPVDIRRLVAAVSAERLRASEHTLAITWLGAEATTTSRKSYILRMP